MNTLALWQLNIIGSKLRVSCQCFLGNAFHGRTSRVRSAPQAPLRGQLVT